MATPGVDYILVPNQHIGAWEVSFMPQWITREYLARRNGAKFTKQQVVPSRCPLLGWSPDSIMVEALVFLALSDHQILPFLYRMACGVS